jgi:hypothetical protein
VTTHVATRRATRAATQAASFRRKWGLKPLSKLRPNITGSGTYAWDITFNGASIRSIGGYNLGEFDYYETVDADTVIAALYAMGVRLVRLVGFWRWFSDPAKGDADSRLDSAARYTNPIHEAKLKAHARAVEKISRAHPTDPMWFIIVGEGDILQSGTQSQTVYTHALSLVQPGEVIPGGFDAWWKAGGYNLFTSAFLRTVWLLRWAWAAYEFRSYDYCYGFEGLSEPLPGAGLWDDNTYGPGLAGTSIYPAGYDSTWSSGSTSNHETVESLYRMWLRVVRAIAPNTPCIAGSRGGYNILPECQELVTALSNPGGLGGNWIAKNCLIFTFDHLDGGVIVPENTPVKYHDFLTMNVPAYMNQLGSRNDHDPNCYGINLAQSVCNAWGVGPVIWEYRANNANGYGPYYSNHDSPMTFSTVAVRQAANQARFLETLATLEAAAFAAVDADGGVLFVPKADLSNCYASDGTTLLTLGTTTPGTTTLGKITAIRDPLATGLTFTATGTACPKVAYPWVDGSGNPMLPARRLGLKFDGVNTFLSGSALYWRNDGVDTDVTMIAAGIGATVTANQTLLCQSNNAGSTDRYRVSFGATHVAIASWQGDDAAAKTCTGTSPQGVNTPIVVSGTKSGVSGSHVLTVFVNGLQETQLTGQSVGTCTQFTRLRVGATGNTPDFTGVIMGWYVSKNAMSDANRLKIERYLGFLHGGGCKR